jgi:hypothetical protein
VKSERNYLPPPTAAYGGASARDKDDKNGRDNEDKRAYYPQERICIPAHLAYKPLHRCNDTEHSGSDGEQRCNEPAIAAPEKLNGKRCYDEEESRQDQRKYYVFGILSAPAAMEAAPC